LIGLVYFLYIKKDSKKGIDWFISYIVGIIFTLGLGFSGMLKRSKIISFLTLSNGWDPTIGLVLLTAVTINVITFHLIINKKKKPVYSE